MVLTKTTKKYKRLYHLFLIISILAIVVPTLIALIKGYTCKELTESIKEVGADVEAIKEIIGIKRVELSVYTVTLIVLVCASILLKVNIRSLIDVLVVLLFVYIDDTNLLIIACVCYILEQIITTPLFKKMKQLYLINREIDKRG